MRSFPSNDWLRPLAAVALLAGCASTPSVRSDYDKNANFGAFHTFGFVDQGERGQIAGDTDSGGSGGPRDGGPRLQAREPSPTCWCISPASWRTGPTCSPCPGPMYGPAWGYGGWYGAPYGGWAYSSQVTTRHYKVGTLVMDIVDRAKRQVVFQAGMEKTVTNKMLDNQDKVLNAAVTHLFSTYPFVAGQSAPVALPDKK